MKLPDDLLPEEQDPRYEGLITLLQQAKLNPLLADPTERAQILARARVRLFQTDPEGSFTNDVWAVGSVTTSHIGIGVTHTVIAHWNGQRWSIVPSPNPGKVRNELWGVTALSANDVWAVGGFFNSSTQRQIVDESLTMHWNGSRWSVVSSPSPGTLGNDLTSVAARSANDVWAVGTPYNYLIEHWDGSRWSVVRTSNTYGYQWLDGVTLVPHSTTIVAVGGWVLLYIKDPSGEFLSNLRF